MVSQTYPTDFAVYINSDEYPDQQRDYRPLLRDIFHGSQRSLFVGYGPSAKQHDNHLAALRLVDTADYDLFLKIDDDDVYRRGYVESVVESYSEHNWNFSGEHSLGMINGVAWREQVVTENMGVEGSAKCLGLASTWAFSRRSIDIIISLPPHNTWFEDRYWKYTLEHDPQINSTRRANSGLYHQNIHGKNTSTAGWLDPNAVESSPNTMNTGNLLSDNSQLELSPREAAKIGARLIKDSIKVLTRQLVRKLFSLLPSK